MFVEAKIKFDQADYDALEGGYGSGWDFCLVLTSIYNYGIYLYLSLNTSAAEANEGDGGNTPGYHTFMVTSYNTDPNAIPPLYFESEEYRAVGTIAHADLYDGQEHIIRLEWKSATVFSTLTDYLNGNTYTLPDGEIAFYVDGVLLYSAANVAFCLDTGSQSAIDRPNAFDALGTFQVVELESFMGKYAYIKVGLASGTWVDVADFIEQEVSDSDFANGIARVRCKLWTRDSGVMVKARLYDVINGVSVGESAEIISQTPVDATFSVTLTTGVTRYHLQLTSDTVESDLFAIGAGLIQ
jgi:hypothetical protein